MASNVLTDKMLLDIKDRLQDKTINPVRLIAREAGVSQPTEGKKAELIEKILAIASCKIPPIPRSKRGAPPKSCEYDEMLVADIKACMEYYTLLKNGNATNNNLEVSDGTGGQVCGGILVKTENNFFLRTNGCLASADDVFVSQVFVNRFKLKEGDFVNGECRHNPSDDFAVLTKVFPAAESCRMEFAKLTPIYPNKRMHIANSGKDIAARMIDLFSPIGCGQRAVISAPATSEIALIKQIAAGISSNEEDCSVVVFIVAGSPEDITDLERSHLGVEVFGTTFDLEQNQNIQAAEFVVKYCKSAVERGKNTVLIVSGLSKLQNDAKRFLSSAICAEEGGSLTIIATVSAQGEYSSEYSAELLSAANMRAELADGVAHTPVIDVTKSYTLNCGLLQTEEEQKTADILRKQCQTTGLQDVIQLFKNTENNMEIIK